ncbi:MAG: hypothetical protein JO165_11050 [Candidatus Eremiobacteraeota bacterium]|nr:hypothetical protein [Candidatus Eremiobacteraeota bacterium]
MRRAALLVPAGFAGAGLLCRYFMLSPPAAISSDLAQPLAVVTYWRAYGTEMWLALFLAVAIAGFGYVAVLRDALAGAFKDTRKAVAWCCGIAACALMFAIIFPVIFSSDVFAYGAYGDIALRGMDPYSHDPLAANDALLRAAVWQWGNPPPMCVYGPAFVWIAQAVVGVLAPLGATLQLDGLRIVASAALVACGPLLFSALSGFSRERRVAAVAGVVLNPIAIWTAAEGHNDALMLVVVLAGVIVARSARPALGAFVIALSSLVKAPGLAAAAAFAMFSAGDRSRFTRVVSGMLAGTLVTALLSLRFEWGVRQVLVPRGHYTPQFSLQFVTATISQWIFGANDNAFFAGVAFALLLCGALFIFGAAQTIRGQREGFAYLALALWLAIPNPYPWYAMWMLPVAFVALNSRASWAIVLASLTSVFRYLPDATVSNDTQTNFIVALCMLAIPLAVFTLQPAPAVRERTLEP